MTRLNYLQIRPAQTLSPDSLEPLLEPNTLLVRVRSGRQLSLYFKLENFLYVELNAHKSNWKGWGNKSQGKDLLAFRNSGSAKSQEATLLSICLFQQKGVASFHFINIKPVFSRVFPFFKMFFSISKATRNCQRSCLRCSRRRKLYVKSMGNFWSGLMSMWGKQKQVPFRRLSYFLGSQSRGCSQNWPFKNANTVFLRSQKFYRAFPREMWGLISSQEREGEGNYYLLSSSCI